MNIIDLFKALGFYDGRGSVDKFYVAFLPGHSSYNPPYVCCEVSNGTVYGLWFREIKSQKAGQSGILFYIGFRSTMSEKEKEGRMSRENGRFNNFWPERGKEGEIDLRKTIELNFLAPEIDSPF